MKLIPRFFLALLVLTCAVGRVMAEETLTVAVFDFESKDEGMREMGAKIAVLISANLSAEPNIITVERAELEKVLSEQELGISGTVSTESAARIGKLTGAKVLITGKVFQVEKNLVLVGKIIGTETSRVYGEVVNGKPGAAITDLAVDLARKIAADVTQKSDTLVAKVETHEERIARIKKALGDKKLPAVSVKIPEQHFGQHVIDPAAQTEIGLMLKESGFTLVDEGSTNKADIEITGEAFSEAGMRKGNLQSCRARIEIKVREIATGNIIAVDRQTSGAVDLAEHVAAKSALQNGAAELAERLLPKLVK